MQDLLTIASAYVESEKMIRLALRWNDGKLLETASKAEIDSAWEFRTLTEAGPLRGRETIIGMTES